MEREHRLAHIPVYYNLQFITQLANKASLKKVRNLCNTINLIQCMNLEHSSE